MAASMPDFSGAATTQGYGTNPNWSNPFGSSTWTNPTDGSRPTVNQTLTPQEAAILAQNQGIRSGVAGGVSSGLPSWMSAMQSPLGYGAIQNNLNLSGAPAMPVANQDVLNQNIQAAYQKGAQYLDPQFTQAHTALDSSLANQGIVANPTPGGGANPNASAWEKAQSNLADQQQKAYSDLRDSSIGTGLSAMQNYFGMQMGARQQGVNEIAGQGQFANAAQNQGFGQNVTQHTLPAQLLQSTYNMTTPNIPQFQGTQQSPFVQAAGFQGQANTAANNAKTGLVSTSLAGLSSIIAQNPGLLTSLPAAVVKAWQQYTQTGQDSTNGAPISIDLSGSTTPSDLTNFTTDPTTPNFNYDPTTGAGSVLDPTNWTLP